MSSEAMLTAPPPYKRVDNDVERTERKQQYARTIFALLVVAVLIGMAAMFAGGYYAGKKHSDDHDHYHNHHQSDAPQNFRFQDADGNYVDVPTINGNQPMVDFLQCRTVTTDNQKSCVPSNPILTPKGTLQLTLYKHGNDVSLVATGTGSQYGEAQSSRSARSAATDRKVAVHLTNFRGVRLRPGGDDYHSFMDTHRWTEPGHATANLTWSSFFSHSVVFHLNCTQWTGKVGLYFKHRYNGTEVPPATIRGGQNISTWDIGALPTEDRPLSIFPTPVPDKIHAFGGRDRFVQPDEDKVSLENSPLKTYNIFLSSLDDLRAKRQVRSITSEDRRQRGAMFKLFDKESPKKALSTIRVMHDNRHGGGNGTILFDVTNHTAGCHAQFSVLFHEFLTDGKQFENTTHHQTFLYHHCNATHSNISMWQSIIPPTQPQSSRKVPLVGKIPSKLTCISDELNELHNRLRDASMQNNVRQKRSLHWKCGVAYSLEGGADCGYHAYTCGREIAETDFTFGLTLLMAGWDCYEAVSNCYGYLHKCL